MGTTSDGITLNNEKLGMLYGNHIYIVRRDRIVNTDINCGAKTMSTQLQERSFKSNRATILLSVPATLLWVGVGAFLLRWYFAWGTGNLQPGLRTSWTALYVFFGIATLAVAGGFCLTTMAWIGKSTVRWQIVSVVLGVLFLWMVAGH